MIADMDGHDLTLIIISGPVGVGKTSVAEELSGLLAEDKVAHTFIDLDGLSKTYPRPADDKYGERIALKNLQDVWANARALGVKTLIIARVIETPEGARRIEHTVGAISSTVIQLNASDETLLDRVRQREAGSGREWHERRALALSAQMQNSRVATLMLETDDKSVSEIAGEIQPLVKHLF